MKSTIGAIALVGVVLAAPVAIALVATAAFAENTVVEHRAQLAQLWGKDSVGTARQTATARMNSTGLGEQRRDQSADRWAKDHSTFRERDHAER